MQKERVLRPTLCRHFALDKVDVTTLTKTSDSTVVPD